MLLLEKGRVCIIKRGRDFGKLCVVLGPMEKNMVEVDGPKIQKHKINVSHVWLLDKVVSDIKPKELGKVIKL